MRRFLAAIGITATLAVAWAGAAPPGEASCAATATLEQVASEPGIAVFTGWAARGIEGSQDLVFVVDRWFHGGHAAREIRLVGSTAGLADDEARGPVAVALAEVIAGDAITLNRDEPVLMVGEWVAGERAFGVRFCTVAGVALDSPEGRAAFAEAEAAFGPGRPGADLPDTSSLLPADRADGTPLQAIAEWWLPGLALVLAASSVLVLRRLDRT